ncbi:MAG: hypothetical protein HQ557_02380 [Bacteroidetes bacterium]|nr:hypothetical protein [Bacteroidota bacterium]
MKSSGSKTLSAFLMLVLFASIFFLSCGLPKNPFIVETYIKSNNYLGPINVESTNNFLDFSILTIDDIYTNNGINIFYCYTNSETISLSNPANLKLINTTSYNNPQHVEIDAEIYDLYIFKIGEDNTYTLPSINIDDVLASLSGSTSLDGRIDASAVSDDIFLDLSLYLTTDSTIDLLSNGRLVRYTVGSGKESIILSTDDYEESENITTDVFYYLHIFGSYYAKEPSYEIDHDSIIADAAVAYLGSVELQNY